MNPVQMICRKRDGEELSSVEIATLILGYVDGLIADHQMSAFAMAVYFRGMTDAEISSLTEAMLLSGVTLNWPCGMPVVDKHSTGGIGDKVSLVLAPLLASCGLRVPMLSGRGLGPTGGTLDKLEAIPGFRANLELRELQQIVEDVGCVITGTTSEIVPADRKLYALRDITGTVPSIPLITASIMSKKLAERLDGLVLDVKWGSGAFMKTREQAESLARSLVRVGQQLGTPTTALVTDMNQPLGRMCGNAVEVQESLDCLQGRGPRDLRELTLALGAELLARVRSESAAVAMIELTRRLDSGDAYALFERMVAAQGGRLAEKREVAPERLVTSDRAGFVTSIDVAALGFAIIDLGGGRKQFGDRIDHGVGLEMLVRIGDAVSVGQPLVRVFARPGAEATLVDIDRSVTISEAPTDLPELIVARIE